MREAFGVIVTSLACYAGFVICGDPARWPRPVDETGRTSIVVELENGDWCELRGPARFIVLDRFAAPTWSDDTARNAEFTGTEHPVRSAD